MPRKNSKPYRQFCFIVIQVSNKSEVNLKETSAITDSVIDELFFSTEKKNV